MEDVFNNEENIVELIKRYKKLHWGYIAKTYSKEEEQDAYREAAKLISDRYGHIISYDEIFDNLSNRGRIYTMDIIKNVRAFYDKKTGNIGLPHFLNRLTTISMHEFVHKNGFEVGDESFKNMSVVFNEAGTELVSARSLSDQEGRNFLFKSVWAKFPEKVDDSFLNVCLTNQLNEALGGESLEKSILKGRDFFKDAIIQKYGEARFVFLKENMEDLSREEKNYWELYHYLSDEQRAFREQKMKENIFVIQDCILEAEFDKRFNEVDSLESGKKCLNELKKIGLNRVRIKQDDDSFVDPGFKEYFEKYKKQIEAKYGKTDIVYDESEWEKLYEEKETIEDVSNEEKRTILDMSIMFNKNHKNKNVFSKFFNSMLKKQEVLPESFDNKKYNKSIDFRQYIDNNQNYDQNLNQSRLKGSMAPQNIKKTIEDDQK